MIDPTHPTVRTMTLEAAEEIQAIYRRNDPDRRSIASGLAGGSDVANEVVAAHATLLVDFTRPATRDRWVRWGIAHDSMEIDTRLDIEDAHDRATLQINPDFTTPEAVDFQRSRRRTAMKRDAASKWHSMRDDPEAIEAAVSAALRGAP